MAYNLIVPLNSKTLLVAMEFATKMLLDKNFNHFKHTMPNRMLTDEWDAWLAMEGSMVVSWGQIQKFPDNPRKQHVIRLGFCVLPDYHGQGFGSAMMERVLNECSNYGKLTATVYADNTVMLGMFLRRKFVVEGCFQNEEILDGTLKHILSLARYQ